MKRMGRCGSLSCMMAEEASVQRNQCFFHLVTPQKVPLFFFRVSDPALGHDPGNFP